MKCLAGRSARPSGRSAAHRLSAQRRGAASFTGDARGLHAIACSALGFVLCAPFVLASSSAGAADMNAVNHPASVASAVGAGTAVPSLGIGAVLQTIFGLLVVIGMVFACAWLARRFGLQPGSRGGIVKTVGGTSLGGKERVAVVEIGDTWLVLGAAPGNVRLLHTMPAGSVTAAGLSGTADPGSAANPGSALPGTFGQRFRDALKGEVGKRFNRPDGRDQ
ncbi:MAG: flagellar biosynthetic protein FliO [Paraburkholderia sp.]|jgi:flagellar protein FliO/FliZ|uniref:flagellar biosynthetic protein FliO n=1 Tax=Burkholderiaceae TaxID=119060 RepID=UPI0020174759|nr:flagellar biosynthetic protein FliO [Burkholderia sp. 4M9327F10]